MICAVATDTVGSLENYPRESTDSGHWTPLLMWKT